MAVRHGYGKVATDGLVFAYDTGDTVNSYKGEPTENLVTNPTFLGTSGTQTSATSDNWVFSGDSSAAGFNFYDSSTSPIPLKFPNEGAVITTGTTSSNRRIYFRGPVQPSTTYTLSYWIYSTAQTSVTNYFFTYDSGSNTITTDTYIFSKSVTTGTWYYVEQSYTTPSNTDNTKNVYWGPVINSTSDTLIALQRFQVEVNSHATPFVNGTRSNTEGLLDLTGLGGIDLSNVSFDSNAQMTFDGTDDRIELGDTFDLADHFVDNQSFTIEVVVNILSSTAAGNGYAGIFTNQKYQTESDPGGFGLAISTPGGLHFRLMMTDSTPTSYQGNAIMSINVGQMEHITYTYDSAADTVTAYRNGESTSTTVSSTIQWSVPTDSTRTAIGRNTQGGWGSYYNSDLPVVKCYNRALTADEIRNNYRHYKNRFNI